MEYTDNVQTVVQRHVEDDVAAERQAAHTRCKLVALSAHQWLRGQQLKLLVELVDPGIRLINAVVSRCIPRCPRYQRPLEGGEGREAFTCLLSLISPPHAARDLAA